MTEPTTPSRGSMRPAGDDRDLRAASRCRELKAIIIRRKVRLAIKRLYAPANPAMQYRMEPLAGEVPVRSPDNNGVVRAPSFIDKCRSSRLEAPCRDCSRP